MDATYLNPVLNAIVKVMKMMANQDVTRGEILLKNNDLAFGEISSVLMLKGAEIQGSISVSFPLEVIMKIAEIMLPPDTPRDNAMIKDLTGEMGNMFAGVAKSEMENNGLKFDISLPTILAGKPHHIKHIIKEAAIFVPFYSSVGTFFVEICFGKKAKTTQVIRSELSYRGPSSLT